VSLRRGSDRRITREVDDITLSFTFLDEQKALDKLPNYVSDNPDSMPSLRIYEDDLILVDFTSFMKRF